MPFPGLSPTETRGLLLSPSGKICSREGSLSEPHRHAETPKPQGERGCRLPVRAPAEPPADAQSPTPAMCVSQVGHPAQASPHQVTAAPAGAMRCPRTTRPSPGNPQSWEKIYNGGCFKLLLSYVWGCLLQSDRSLSQAPTKCQAET